MPITFKIVYGWQYNLLHILHFMKFIQIFLNFELIMYFNLIWQNVLYFYNIITIIYIKGFNDNIYNIKFAADD